MRGLILWVCLLTPCVLASVQTRQMNSTAGNDGPERPEQEGPPSFVEAFQQTNNLFDISSIPHVELEIESGDLDALYLDQTWKLKFPARMGLKGERKIDILVRHKSDQRGTGSHNINHEANPKKINFKLHVDGQDLSQRWRGISQVTLNNGDDGNIIGECLGYQMHLAASTLMSPELPIAARSSWWKLTVNGDYLGVYCAFEMKDVSYLEQRGWADENTYLYKRGNGGLELRYGEEGGSTIQSEVCSPYGEGSRCRDQGYDYYDRYFNIREYNVFMAAGWFAQCSKTTTEYWWIDRPQDPSFKRIYLCHDLDDCCPSSVGKMSAHGSTSKIGEMLGNDQIEREYFEVMRELLDPDNGPLSPSSLEQMRDRVSQIETQMRDDDEMVQILNSGSNFDAIFAALIGRSHALYSALPPPSL